MFETIASVDYVRDETVASGVPCLECCDIDAYVVLNVYVREWGQTVRFAECCVNCGQRIAMSERAAEVLIEIPLSLKADVEAELAKVAA